MSEAPRRHDNGQFYSRTQAEASRLLFDDETYIPQKPDNLFQLGPESISYTDLVKRLEKARKS